MPASGHVGWRFNLHIAPQRRWIQAATQALRKLDRCNFIIVTARKARGVWDRNRNVLANLIGMATSHAWQGIHKLCDPPLNRRRSGDCIGRDNRLWTVGPVRSSPEVIGSTTRYSAQENQLFQSFQTRTSSFARLWLRHGHPQEVRKM